jgi:galactose mutarotase-like enzyme
LVPFSNRIAYARFRFDGRDCALNQNFLPEPHAIHGDGWQGVWHVEAATRDRAVLTFGIATPAMWDFSAGRVVPGLNLDHCFADWDGRAAIAWPELGLGLAIEADPLFGHCVVAVLAGNVVAVEPVSHANDAINMLARGEGANGLAMIAPGATIGGRVRFALC